MKDEIKKVKINFEINSRYCSWRKNFEKRKKN